MHQLIIYAAGTMFHLFKDFINLNQVDYITDDNPDLHGTTLYGKEIIPPENLCDMDFAGIIIFSSTYYEQIYNRLTKDFNITPSKIIFWGRCYPLNRTFEIYNKIFEDVKSSVCAGSSTSARTSTSAETSGCYRVLDYGMNIKNDGFFHMDQEMSFYGYSPMSHDSLVSHNFAANYNSPTNHESSANDNYSANYNSAVDQYPVANYNSSTEDNSFTHAGIMQLYKNLYKKIFNDYTNIPDYGMDCALLGKIEQYNTMENLVATINTVLDKVDTVYLECPYPDAHNYTWYENGFNFASLGSIKWHNALYTRFLKIHRKTQKNVSIYIAAHKEFTLPSTADNDDIYKTIWLGRSEENKWNYLEDKSGDNISNLNPLINECTGLYWLWKHTADDFVGLVHYRRYFMEDGHVIGKETILQLMKDYDILVHPVDNFGTSVQGQLQLTIHPQAYETGRKLVADSIRAHQPEYVESFETVMSGSFIFPCNMFITRKEIFDRYCEWLFSIIIEPAEKIDVSPYDPYSKRVIGFFAERLFTVWLMKQELKVKEVPVVLEK